MPQQWSQGAEAVESGRLSHAEAPPRSALAARVRLCEASPLESIAYSSASLAIARIAACCDATGSTGAVRLGFLSFDCTGARDIWDTLPFPALRPAALAQVLPLSACTVPGLGLVGAAFLLATVDQSAMSMAVFLDRRAKSPDCAVAGSYLGNFAEAD